MTWEWEGGGVEGHPDSCTGGYFRKRRGMWRGGVVQENERAVSERERERVIHTCSISERLVRIAFTAGVEEKEGTSQRCVM